MEVGTIPSTDSVRAMWDEAHELFGRRSFDLAAARYLDFAEHANRLANLLTSTLVPLDRVDTHASSFDPTEFKRLEQVESLANDLKSQRNMAYVIAAECREQLGDKQAALEGYLEAFNLIGGGRLDAEAWERARNGVFRIVNFRG